MREGMVDCTCTSMRKNCMPGCQKDFWFGVLMDCFVVKKQRRWAARSKAKRKRKYRPRCAKRIFFCETKLRCTLTKKDLAILRVPDFGLF